MVIGLEWDSGHGPEWIKLAWKPDVVAPDV
jgi:hypothetical protein